MGSKQIVLLFDLNAFNEFLLKPSENLHKILLDVRLVCLRLLTTFSTKSTNLRWGFKFFDSYGSITQTMPRYIFSDVSLSAFETLESEICLRYERHLSYLQALAESPPNNIQVTSNSTCIKKLKHSIAPVKILQLALTQILSEFQWEFIDIWSPSTRKVNCSDFYLGNRNFLFLFTSFKDNDDMLLKYFGFTSLPSRTKLANAILPQTLQEQLLNKADVRWVWLNVWQQQKFKGSSKVLPVLSDTLQTIQGSIIPLSLLSQSLFHFKPMKCTESKLLRNKVSIASSLQDGFNNSLLPFSVIFLQSLYQPFYSVITNNSSKSFIHFVEKGIKIPIQVIKALNGKHDSLKENYHNKENNSKIDGSMSSDPAITWSKFIIEGAVSRHIKYTAEDALICLPRDILETPAVKNLAVLNRALFLKEIKLVLSCITGSGLQMPGLLTPLSNEASIISILDPSIHIMHKYDLKVDGISSEVANKNMENSFHEIQSVRTELETCCRGSGGVDFESDTPLKLFQVESLDVWFKPAPTVHSLVSHIKSKSERSKKIQSFHKFLEKNLQENDILKASSFKEEMQNISLNFINQTVEHEIVPDNLEDLVTTCKGIYDSTLESSDSFLDGAKKIVKMVANYFKKKYASSFENDVQNFMKDNLLITAKGISKKYEILQSEVDTNRKIKECQMQVVLLLEVEALILPPDKSHCVNSVTSMLRMMSFYSGAIQLNKLLCDILRENYVNLYDVLVEIGNELDMPIFGETQSSESQSILSSDLADGELFGSVISSNVSEKSSSSICSCKDNRKLARHRSDISDTVRSRQVLLPGVSPKKKKVKSCAQRKALRYSPRLASKKLDRLAKTVEGKPRTVRRNLFPKERSCRTPKENKSNQPSTPRTNRKRSILKTKFVAETPSHKQNHSAFQRRKSFIELDISQGLLKEIAESPKIIGNAKDNTNKELLKKLQHKNSKTSLKAMTEEEKESVSLSFTQYTPESKRRLSLKLFSKLLASPTARTGIKKCTKRLFDQISPRKSSENNKKHKPIQESKDLTV